MNPLKLGDMVSLKIIKREHYRLVRNGTSSLEEASEVLKVSVSSLYRFCEENGLGRPDRKPPESLEDGENFLDD